MSVHRRGLRASAPSVIGAGMVVVGAMLPALAWPLVGAGVALSLGISSTRRALAGCAIGLGAAAASLPVAETAAQQSATAVVIGWAVVATAGWRQATKARRSAEAVIDTVLLAAGGQPAAEPAGHQLLRVLTDILGGTGGHLDPDGVEAAPSSTWDKRTGAAVVPLATAGRRLGSATIHGVRRPASWQLTLADLVATRWADVVDASEWAERLLRPDAIDPITGLGNEHAVTAGLASLAPGDSVIALRLEELTTVRETNGDGRADLLVCQLGLHVRNRLRTNDIVARYGDDRFVVICRDAKDETDAIVDRLLAAWPTWEAGHRLLAMGAVHHDGRSSVDTLDAALDPVGRTSLDLVVDVAWSTHDEVIASRTGGTNGS